jgi:hypothetical protein
MEDQTFANLPLDCFTELLSCLGLRDLFRFSQVCKFTNELIETFCVFETKENVTTLTVSSVPAVIFPPWEDLDFITEDSDTQMVARFPEYVMVYFTYNGTSHCPPAKGAFVCTDDLCIQVYFEGGCSNWVRIGYRDDAYDGMRFYIESDGSWCIDSYDKKSIRAYMILPRIVRYIDYLREWVDYCRK